jgi:hypothetical protein
MQQMLKDAGFNPGPIDGIFGPKTDAALRRFQKANGLQVDGIYGPKSTAALKGATGKSASPGDSGGSSGSGPFGPEPEAQRKGTTSAGGTVIPSGVRLIQVTNPRGADAGEQYFAVWTVFGVDTAYLIGDRSQLDEMFGGAGNFKDTSSMTQGQFDNSGIIVTVGSIDEQVGATESVQAQFERDLHELGLDNPPQWVQGSQDAMSTFLIAVNEGWSPERTWGALAGTAAFDQRFPGLDEIQRQMGTNSFVDSVANYKARESAVRESLLRHRGSNTDTSQQTVSGIVASGWNPTDVEELLDLERMLRSPEGQETFENINNILAFQGLDPLNPDDFVDFMRHNNQQNIEAGQNVLTQPGTISSRAIIDPDGTIRTEPVTTGRAVDDTVFSRFEAINDALRLQALIDEGIEGLTPGFASALGTGESTEIESVEAFSRQAQLAAAEIGRNLRDIDLGRFGLTQEDIIAATFNDASASDKSVSEVQRLIEKLSRERQRAATGFSGTQSFVDAQNRLRIQGFGNV